MSMEIAEREERYWGILQEYLRNESEATLTRGYEFARTALAEGFGIIEMAMMHHAALRRLAVNRQIPESILDQANYFLREALSPFEMSHRGAQEGARALRHLNELLEGESKRIAHALHDEAGQLLASVHIALADVADDLPPELRGRFDAISGLLRQIENELRNLSHELRPTVLDNLGLVPALEFLAERVAKRTGLNVSVVGEPEGRLPPAVETALYRIVQEALNNAAKHAQAHSVRIALQCTPSTIACSVRDDGKGFDVPGEVVAQGLGLLGIRERVNALGGSLRVITEPKHGTTLEASIPIGG